jgi:uncharacterized membrane-anchored protein YitT (DUF2179 family)
MISQLRAAIIKTVLRRHKERKAGKEPHLSRYKVAREVLNLKITALTLLRDVFFISVGVISAGFGLKGFIIPNGFIDGGVTGISLLTAIVSGFPVPLLIVFINIPFIILGYRQVNRSFAIKSIAAISALALCVAFINYPVITSDKLLVAVFGGFFLGAGIGMSVRGGAVIDGTEVLAIFLNRKTRATIGDLILVFNIIIFSVALIFLPLKQHCIPFSPI